MGTLTF